MQDQIIIPEWIIVKSETRNKLRDIFNIPKSGVVETVTDTTGVGRVVSDGCTHRDLEALTIYKMCVFLGIQDSTDNIHDLFSRVVKEIEKPIVLKVEPPSIIPQPEIMIKDAAQESLPVPEPILNGIDRMKCEKCEFKTASKFGMRMHVSRFHKDYN